MRKVYTIGDCVLDIFFENGKPVEAKPGGSFLNSAVSLGRLGVNVSLISEIGEDKLGAQILDFLEENGVGVDHISKFSDTNTNLALAFLDENKNADYSFYKTRQGKASCIRFPKQIKKGDVVMFGSFLAIKKEMRSELTNFLGYCKQQEAVLIYDPNFRAQHLPLLPEVLPYIRENMNLADIVKASNEDFELIFGVKSGEEAVASLREFSDALLIYTANKNGVFVSGNHSVFKDVPQIQPVSTVGAGDTFNAAIAYYLVRNAILREDLPKLSVESIRDLVDIAVRFSQKVCMDYDNFLPMDFAKEYR